MSLNMFYILFYKERVANMDVIEAWQNFYQDKMIQGYSKNTMSAYKTQVNIFHRFVGNKDINEISLIDIKGYIRKRSTEIKTSSLQHTIKFIRSFFKYLQEEGFIENNVSLKIRFPKENVRVPRFIKEETLEEIRMQKKDLLDDMLIEFLYSSGCRIGEVYLLSKDDFDLSSRKVVVRGKGNKEREVYFSKRAEILIRKYFETRKDTLDCFICKRNKPYDRMGVHQMRLRMKNVAKKAGVKENIYPHKLRHTYATHLVNRGAPIEVIQQFLGHSKLDTTMIYAHMSGEHRKRVYDQYF